MSVKILFIEDDEELCEEITEILEDNGFLVNSVFNGLSGKEELKKNEYNLLLLDIKIPVLNGFEILSWLMEKKIDIKTIILTGRPLDEELTKHTRLIDTSEEELLQYADEVMNKPFRIDELISCIKSIV